MQKLLLRCPGLSSAPTLTQHCSQGPCRFSVLFKIFPTFSPFLLSHIWTFTTFKACQAGEDAEPWAPVLATCPAPSTACCLSSLNSPDGERGHQIKKTSQNNTSIIPTTEKDDDLRCHIWAVFSHARVKQQPGEAKNPRSESLLQSEQPLAINFSTDLKIDRNSFLIIKYSAAHYWYML